MHIICYALNSSQFTSDKIVIVIVFFVIS